MSTCQKCGRDSTCLHQNPLSVKETYFLIGFIVLVSQVGYAYFSYYLDSREVVGISLIAYFALIIILMFMLLMYLGFQKQYLALFFGCHQNKGRTFHISKTPLPLCARCTGIFIGIFLSVFLFISEINFLYIYLLVIPLIVDGLLQRFTRYESNNYTRLITGLLFAPGFVILFGYINYFINLGFNYLGAQAVSLFT